VRLSKGGITSLLELRVNALKRAGGKCPQALRVELVYRCFSAGRCSVRPGCAFLGGTVVCIMPVIVEVGALNFRFFENTSYQRALCKNLPVSALENWGCGRGF